MPLHTQGKRLPQFIRNDVDDQFGQRDSAVVRDAMPKRARATKLRFKRERVKKPEHSMKEHSKFGDLDGAQTFHGDRDPDAEPSKNRMEFSGCRIIHYSSRRFPHHQQFAVQSQSDSAKFYKIDLGDGAGKCDCKSYARRLNAALAAFDVPHPCKHILYVQMSKVRNPVIIEHGLDDDDDDADPTSKLSQNPFKTPDGWRESLARWRAQRDARGKANAEFINSSSDAKYARRHRSQKAYDGYDREISDPEENSDREEEAAEGYRRRDPGDFDPEYFTTPGWAGFDPNFFERKRRREHAEQSREQQNSRSYNGKERKNKQRSSSSRGYQHAPNSGGNPSHSRNTTSRSQMFRTFDQFMELWNALETCEGPCTVQSLPCLADGELESFFAHIEPAVAKKRYRKLIMILHPDKFLQRFGSAFADDELEAVLPIVTAISQQVNQFKQS